MTIVYLVNFEREMENGDTYFEMHGIYSSEEKAKDAIAVFSENPKIREAIKKAQGNLSFVIEPYVLDETEWEDGFWISPSYVWRNGRWEEDNR
jgi:hypothetical protein